MLYFLQQNISERGLAMKKLLKDKNLSDEEREEYSNIIIEESEAT